jgi:hypothetical protein
MGRDASDVDMPGSELTKEKHEVFDQPAKSPGFLIACDRKRLETDNFLRRNHLQETLQREFVRGGL